MSDKSKPRNDLLFQRILEILENARHKVYRTANTEMLRAYWNVGKEIVVEEQKGQDRAEYGSALLEELAKRLTELYGRSFSSRHLRYMRQFYREFPKWNAVRSELSWTHYRILLKVEKENARDFYVQEAITGNWSTRQLERQINSLYFDRLLISNDKKGIMLDIDTDKELMHPDIIIKDPFVLEFLDIHESNRLAESDLETALIDKLTHKDIGQMDFYVRFFEDQLKQAGDIPSIGLILCTEKNRTIVKYSLLNESKQIFASRYQLYLPTIEQLEQEIQRERDQIKLEQKLCRE
jgi:predicted nuclease of restriction endonuclease-like (RecB) superfamily